MLDLWVITVTVAIAAGLIACCVTGTLLARLLIKRMSGAKQRHRPSIQEATKPEKVVIDKSDIEQGLNMEKASVLFGVAKLDLLERYMKLELCKLTEIVKSGAHLQVPHQCQQPEAGDIRNATPAEAEAEAKIEQTKPRRQGEKGQVDRFSSSAPTQEGASPTDRGDQLQTDTEACAVQKVALNSAN